MTEEKSKPLLGDPDSNAEFDASVNAIIAKAGVQPLSNPDRVKTPSPHDKYKDDHETAERVTGAARPGLMQGAKKPPPPYVPTSQTTGFTPPGWTTVHDTALHAQMIQQSAGRRASWVGLLGTAQAAGHEVAVHLREDPSVVIVRGKIVNDPALSTLDEVGIVAVKTVKIERDTGGAPRREIVTVMLEDIAALTVIEKIEKKS